KHPVRTATQVEIDGAVIDICREHMPFLSDGAFDDERTDLVIADGVKFVAETAKRFDVIIIDSTDPVGPGEVLFSEAFYADCKRCLTDGGILVTQNGVPLFQGEELTNGIHRLSPHFADVSCYLTVVPTYVGGFMALGWATDDPGPRGLSADDLSPRFDGAGISTRYYSPAVHAASFALPPFIAELVG
ncbi:MAG: polyamine aminopropyltransferase, partial [Rhodospirillales bacterium]|nr:polyamine aminopropyltransferase [Rhodospirillales bacterium]